MEMNVELSIVVPIYNEQDNVEALYTAITSSLQAMGCSYEIIMVDDGSSDGSYQISDRPCIKRRLFEGYPFSSELRSDGCNVCRI